MTFEALKGAGSAQRCGRPDHCLSYIHQNPNLRSKTSSTISIRASSLTLTTLKTRNGSASMLGPDGSISECRIYPSESNRRRQAERPSQRFCSRPASLLGQRGLSFGFVGGYREPFDLGRRARHQPHGDAAATYAQARHAARAGAPCHYFCRQPHGRQFNNGVI